MDKDLIRVSACTLGVFACFFSVLYGICCVAYLTTDYTQFVFLYDVGTRVGLCFAAIVLIVVSRLLAGAFIWKTVHSNRRISDIRHELEAELSGKRLVMFRNKWNTIKIRAERD